MRIFRLEKNKTLLSVLIMPLFLAACATNRFDTGQSTGLVLPPVIQYDGELLEKAADEFESGAAPALTELVKDYKLTRDRLRIAHKEMNKYFFAGKSIQ
jgi:hypothetical protein